MISFDYLPSLFRVRTEGFMFDSHLWGLGCALLKNSILGLHNCPLLPDFPLLSNLSWSMIQMRINFYCYTNILNRRKFKRLHITWYPPLNKLAVVWRFSCLSYKTLVFSTINVKSRDRCLIWLTLWKSTLISDYILLNSLR